MGPEAGFLNSGQFPFIALGGLAAVATFLLLTLLTFLCTSCDREKKPKHQNGDHENLMNVPSDKETFSRSVTSLATEPPPSTYQNGGISNGDVISEDSTTACIEPYEVQTSCPDLVDQLDSLGKSTKHPQSRELPSIPPGSNMEAIVPVNTDPCLGTEGPYEVLKDSASQDNIMDDCLYETVNELKENCVTAGTAASQTLDFIFVETTFQNTDPSPEYRTESAEYASVDRNRKSQQGVFVERPCSYSVEKEDEDPPPVPEKLLDENENVHAKDAEQTQESSEEEAEGASSPRKGNGSLCYTSLKEESCLQDDDIASMYSSVSKPGQSIMIQDELANYAYIQDLSARRSSSLGNEIYSNIRDLEKSPGLYGDPESELSTYDGLDSDYEAIESMTKDDERTVAMSNDLHTVLPTGESDYESIGDVNQNGDVTRL